MIRSRTTLRWLALTSLGLALLNAQEHRGVVRFGGLPVPGTSVTLTQDGKKAGVITDGQGTYRIPVNTALPFAVDVDMQLFAPAHREFTGR